MATKKQIKEIINFSLVNKLFPRKKYTEVAEAVDHLIDVMQNADRPVAVNKARVKGVHAEQIINQDGKVTWSARVNNVYDHNDIRRYKRFSADTETDAVNEAYAYQQSCSKVGNKYYIAEKDNEPTVSEWFDVYINSLSCKEVTKKEYRSMKKRYLINADESLPKLANMKLVDVTVDHVEELKDSMRELGYSTQTVNGFKNQLSSSFKYAIKRERLIRNVFSQVTGLSKVFEPPMYLLDSELRELLQASKNPESELFINLLSFTAMRFGEGRGIMWKDINFETGEIQVLRQVQEGVDGKVTSLKTKSSIRTLELDSEMELFNILRAEKVKQKRMLGIGFSEDRLVFSAPDGKPLSENYFRDRLKKVQVDLTFTKERSWSFHTLRHTYCTLNLARGVDVMVISRIAGHSDIRTTYENYYHAIKGEGKKVSTDYSEIIYAKPINKISVK